MARLTQQRFMVQLLSRPKVPTNEKLAELLQKQFPGCKVDSTKINWYISTYRRGGLQGQKGRPKTINRKDLPFTRVSRKDQIATSLKRKKKAARKS